MSESRQAKLAFIGCGGFATSAIFPQIPLLPEIDLVAVCDVVKEKAERNARNYGARRVYTDLDEMLDKEELDGVFAIGPAPQQYELAPQVLKRGIPVYVEKPSANTSAEAKELAELAEANGVWGQCGFMKRFADAYTIAKEIVGREEFGPIHLIKCKFGQGPYPQIWGIDSAKRAMLIGQLVHVFDLIRFFGGDVTALNAFFHQVTDTQFAYAVNLQFESGAIGQLDVNSLEDRVGFRDITEILEVIGLETHVICEDKIGVRYQPKNDWTTVAPHTGRYEQVWRPGWTGISNTKLTFGYTGEVRHFAQRCLGQVEDGPDLWDSYKALKIGEAIYDSAHGAGTVTIAY